MAFYKIIIQLLNNLALLCVIFFLTNCSNSSTKSEKLDESIIRYPDPRERAIRKKLGNQSTFLSDVFKKEKETNINTVSLDINPFIWQASLDILSTTMPLASVDSNSGIIITDWYNLKGKKNERIKISILVSSQELRADGVKVSVFKQALKSNTWENVNVSPNIIQKLERKIITKAGSLQLKNN
jgi:hypothetical protein